MNIIKNVDQLINSLETVKTANLNSKDAQISGEFIGLFKEASSKIDALASLNFRKSELEFESSGIEKSVDGEIQTQNWLCDNQEVAILKRPNLKEFIDSTGVSPEDAGEILYGVIGANADLRDWSKIMASKNPVDAARAATAQLYNSDNEYALVNHADYGSERFADTLHQKSLTSKTVIKKSGNFAAVNTSEVTHIMAISKDGLILRDAGSSAEQVQRTAWLFGFDKPTWLES